MAQVGRREADGSDAELSGTDSDGDAERVRPDDLLLLAARAEDDAATLEVWLLSGEGGDAGAGGAYVHHDVMLPAFPLCIAWADCAPGCALARDGASAAGAFAAGHAGCEVLSQLLRASSSTGSTGSTACVCNSVAA